jgi:hypothetical protein
VLNNVFIVMKKILIPFVLLALFGCGKADELAPEVAMISPGNNQVFPGGQTVVVKANISDNEGIHMVHAICTDETGGHLLHFEEHLDAKTYSLNQSFPTISGRTYTIEVEATDHAENVTKKVVVVTTN